MQRAHTDFHVVIQPRVGTVSMSWGWPHNRFPGNMAKCRSTQWNLTFASEAVEPVEIHRLLVEVYEAYFISRKRVDIVQRLRQRQDRCRLKEMTRTPHHVHWRRVVHAFTRHGRHTTPTPLELHILRGSEHSTVHDQLDYRQAWARWMPKNLKSRSSTCRTLMHLTC
jgi:hypothetical protein